MQGNRSKSEEMLRTGSFGKLAQKLCIPTILIMLVNVLYHMADVFFIGQTGDPNMVAAVTLASPLFTILSGLGVLLGNGGCTAMSLSLGKGDYGKIKKISAFCVWAAILIGFLFTAAVLVFMNPVCGFLGTDAATKDFTSAYLRVIAVGAPVIMLTNVVPALIRADGSTTDSMVGNLIGTGLNIVLDPLLISVLHLGVTGAALATVLGNLAGMVFYANFLRTKGKIYSASPKDVSLEKGIVLQVLGLGLPMASSTILMSVASAIANNMMMEYGAIAVAGQSVAGRIGTLISMTVMGICIGMQPAISYNYSANERKRLMDILKKTTILAVVSGIVLSALCLLLRDKLLMAFIKNDEVLEIGRICMLASIAVGPIYGIYQICATYLQATGKSTWATIVSLLNKGIIYIPALLLMKAAFGMYGIIFANAVTTVLSTVAALIFTRMDFRKEMGK